MVFSKDGTMGKYKFGTRSRNNLNEVHRDFTILFEEVLKERDCSIIEGARSEEEQNNLFDAKKSKVKYPNSKHNVKEGELLAYAVDALPCPFATTDWTNIKKFYHFVGYVKGIADKLYRDGKMEHKLRCGADWDSDFDFKDQTFHDLPHFELIR